jgi:cell division protein ZapE
MVTVLSETITVDGRPLFVPKTARGVARFSFDELCGTPTGSADYIALCKKYHTIFLSDVPKMGMLQRNEARRFITLIDEIYNHKVKLSILAFF